MTQNAEQILTQISALADQLCVTIDDRFDFRLKADSDDDRMLKLVMMMNFLLERVRQNIGQLAEAKNELEERVKDRTSLLELIISGSNDGVWIWRLENNQLEVSERFASLMGLSINELKSPEHWFARVHPADEASLRVRLRQYLANAQGELAHQYRVLDKDQSYRWVVLRGALKRDDEGNPSLLAGTQSDITALVSVDAETGLPNESAFIDWIEQHSSGQSDFALALCGIDHMGSLLEALEGQQLHNLRKEVRERILNTLPLNAFAAKMQGDVYAIAFKRNVVDLDQVFKALGRAFSAPIILGGYGAVQLSVSLGVLESTEARQKDSESCLSALWSALRKARETEGHTLTRFNDALRQERSRVLKVEANVRDALSQGRVKAFLQPIVNANTHKVAGFEALVRIRDIDGSMMSPADFIPVVETTDLIGPLTDQVLRQALFQLKQWRDLGLVEESLFVAVNLASRHILSGELPSIIAQALQDSGLPPSVLKLELTETVVVENMEAAVEQLQHLRSLGCRVAIDDFGTGYSSLQYLQKLPLDVLKLDRAFVQGIETSETTSAIARTICELAKLLGLDVVAEGVETEAQAKLLASVGAGYLQGFYFARPEPMSAIELWLRERKSA